MPLSKDKWSDENVCYVTPIKAYALFFLRNKEINHVTCEVSSKGKVIYNEQFPNQLKKAYQGRKGYLYTCANDGSIAEAHAPGIWSTTKSVFIASFEYIGDVYAEILNAEKLDIVKIIRYETLSDKEKQKISYFVKKFIIEGGLLASDTAKARYYAENYPQPWKEAKESEMMKIK